MSQNINPQLFKAKSYLWDSHKRKSAVTSTVDTLINPRWAFSISSFKLCYCFISASHSCDWYWPLSLKADSKPTEVFPLNSMGFESGPRAAWDRRKHRASSNVHCLSHLRRQHKVTRFHTTAGWRKGVVFSPWKNSMFGQKFEYRDISSANQNIAIWKLCFHASGEL